LARQTPAEWLGVKKGKLAVGYDADLLLVDQNLELQQVFLDGKPIQ
jgi:N-acetylglucosamine-6-phosphate deacetylase